MASHFFVIQSLFLFSQRSLSTQFCPDLPMISVEEPKLLYIKLERYFKTGSGHAFWHKRFIRLPSIDGS